MKNYLKNKFLGITAFSVVMLFMSSTVFAQVQENAQDTTAQDTTQMNQQQQTEPQDQYQRTGDDTQSQAPDMGIDYSETINKEELPQEVNSSLDELYPAHEVSEAFQGEDDSYKVKVKNEDDEAAVYYDSEGKFLRAENLSGLQQEGALPQEQGQRPQESQDQGEWGTDDTKDQQGTQQETQGTQSDTIGEGSAFPQEQNQQTDDRLRSQDHDKGVDYSETIQKNDLPQEVTSSLDELYPAHDVEEAYKGNDDSYKVKVKNEDDKAVVYYDSQGDFLRAQNTSDSQQESALPQEQSQRMQDQEWGTDDQRDQQTGWESDTTKSDTLNEGSAYPQEQSQRIGDDLKSDMQDRADDIQSDMQDRADDVQSDMHERADEMQSDINDTADDMRSGMHNEGTEYSEKINESELPQEVTSSIDEMYPDNEISEVYRGEDDTYKVKLNIQDDEAVAYFDDKGEFLRVGQGNQQQASPQEQNQRIQDVEESQDADRWGTEQRMPEQEMKDDNMNSGTDDEETNWGPEDQGAHQSTWEEDSVENANSQESSQQGQWESNNDTVQNEGSAMPQEQNQKTNTTWDTEGNRSTESDFGPDEENYTAPVDTVASPQEQFQRGTGGGTSDVDYSEEIQENELPESITTSLDDLYPDHEIEEAYRGEDNSYKVKVKKGDEKVAVFYDSEGLFHRDENLNDMQEGMHQEDNKDTNQDW